MAKEFSLEIKSNIREAIEALQKMKEIAKNLHCSYDPHSIISDEDADKLEACLKKNQPDRENCAHDWQESYYGFTCSKCGEFTYEWAFDCDLDIPIMDDEDLD